MAIIFAIAVFFGMLALLPGLLRQIKRHRNGRLAGVAMGIGFAFSALFEPAKAAATEEISRQKRGSGDRLHGHTEGRASGVVEDDARRSEL